MNEGIIMSEATPATRGKAVKITVVLGIVAVLALLVVALGKEAAPYLEGFARWVEGLGLWGPIVFVAGYAVLTVALIPGSPLTMAAGAIFGLPLGTLYALTGASLGACGAFLTSRTIARGSVERRLEGNEKFLAVDRAIGDRGLFICLLLRLSPVFPFNLLNYGLGLTKVRFHHYALACIGMLPGTLLYVYLGFAAGNVAAALSGTSERESGPLDHALLVFGLGATILVTTWITRIARRALKEAAGDGSSSNPPTG